MKAAALVFLVSAIFLGGVLAGAIRFGSSQRAPGSIELPRIAVPDQGGAPSAGRAEVPKVVDATFVDRYRPQRTDYGRSR